MLICLPRQPPEDDEQQRREGQEVGFFDLGHAG